MERFRPSLTDAGIAIVSAAIAYAYVRTSAPSEAPAAAALVLAMGAVGAATPPDRPDRRGLVVALVACAIGVLVGSVGQSIARTSLLLFVFAVGRAGRMVQLERRSRERRAAAALAEERARIARDLHDVIAHSLGVVMVQLQAAETVLDSDPGRAKAALHSAAKVGRDALDEMHRMVGVMRGGERRSAQPSLADLGALVEQAEATGMVVRFVVDEEPGAAEPPGVQVAAFRIVQEALANVTRHAGGATVSVRLARRRDGLSIEIVDSGGRRQHPSPGGFGIEGMRERAALYGGTLEAGPQGDGFAVRAWFPARST